MQDDDTRTLLPCEADPNLFFTDDGTYAGARIYGPPGTIEKAINKAKSLCAGCTHSDDCLTGAMNRNERYGIWGGLTADEIRRLRRRTRRAS